MKQTVKRLLRKTSALDAISRATAANRVDIFLYHGFCAGTERDPCFPRLMPIEAFEEQIRIFARYGTPLRLQDLLAGASSGIVITFDDGYASNYRLAFPVLEKHRFPATVFVTTGFVDGTVPLWGDWLEFLLTTAPALHTAFEHRGKQIALDLTSPAAAAKILQRLKQDLGGWPIGEVHNFLRRLEAHLRIAYRWDMAPEALRPLRWNEIRAMQLSGLLSFGAHTVSHPVLSQCAECVQRYEISESKRRLEAELGEPCFLFAYPYGKRSDYTGATKRIVKESGYRLALTAESGANTAFCYDCHEVKRWGADISGDDLSFLVSGGPMISRYLKHSILWQSLVGSAQ